MFSRRKMLQAVVAIAGVTAIGSGRAAEPGAEATASYRSEAGGAPKGSPSTATLGYTLAAGEAASFATERAATAAGAAQETALGAQIPSSGALVPDAAVPAAAETRTYRPSEGEGEPK
jgi:hypothetical protein